VLCFVSNSFLLAQDTTKPKEKPAPLFSITPCHSEKVYSAKDAQLLSVIGKKYAHPVNKPKYVKGRETLQTYFRTKKVQSSYARAKVIEVAVGFFVDCKGKVDNFQIVSKHSGKEQEVADEVFNFAKEAPHEWKPASIDNVTVDCYQVLLFTVINGKLHAVDYRT
jgi:hypothetical protein